MSDEPSRGGGGGASRITSDFEIELQQFAEVDVAFGVASSVIRDCLARIRAARTERDRNLIRDELRGFIRRLSLGLWALCFPGEPHHHDGNVKETP